MKKKTVMLYPSLNSQGNKYMSNLYETIKNNYNVIGYTEASKYEKLFEPDIYHFNWIESISGKLNMFKTKLIITFLKLTNKKIIWTMHNNFPHESKDKKNTIKFMEFMAKKADRIHILCKETSNNKFISKYKEKIVCIPHGDYINNYQASNVNIYERYKIDKDKKIMLFVGQVRKYKNIELLIQAFKKSNIEENGFVLLICGNCNDDQYKEELKKFSSESIFFDFNFIKDEEMERYLASSQIIVAPYNKNSSLNSGTLWMALSYEKTMMLPLIGCVKDIKNYDDFLYTYDYDAENEEMHYNALLNCMMKLKKDIEKNTNILEEKGKKGYNYIVNNQTWKALKDKWINLYKF